MGIELRVVPAETGAAGPICERLLASASAWFELDEANADYVRMADAHESVVASIDGSDVGLTTVVRHFPAAAEVHLMVVDVGHHRHGVGRAMLGHVEERLAADGVRFLQVKTLGFSRPDPDYDKTRAFWLAMGFEPLEEFSDLWDEENPALQLVKVLPPRT